MCDTAIDGDAQWWEKYSFTDHGWPTKLNEQNIYFTWSLSACWSHACPVILFQKDNLERELLYC